MWDSKLAALASDYETGVLSWVEPSGYPISIRVAPKLDEARQAVMFTSLSPIAKDWRGKACLLFHRHNEHLEGLRQMVLKGELVEDEGTLIFKVGEFVTANGRPDTDTMPHAGAPLHMFQFYLLGRRKSKEYIAKRGEPWPPIPFDYITRAVSEDTVVSR